MTRQLWVDTSVLAYAAGGDHPQREHCRRVVAAAAARTVELHATVEMVQELLFHRMRRASRAEAVAQARFAAGLCVLHPFDGAVLGRALELVAVSELGGRDAVHAASALAAGFTAIVSADRDFDMAPGLVRLDPGDLRLG
ncbi:MAG: type II toxin-antitoxin system VapC family toxin [Actinomycetota bacterium]